MLIHLPQSQPVEFHLSKAVCSGESKSFKTSCFKGFTVVFALQFLDFSCKLGWLLWLAWLLTNYFIKWKRFLIPKITLKTFNRTKTDLVAIFPLPQLFLEELKPVAFKISNKVNGRVTVNCPNFLGAIQAIEKCNCHLYCLFWCLEVYAQK